uniref:Adaptor related protein complex 5 subunit sigma 1 n=1 Tax=Apteryx owenii TaxID=8824 RepID=A0A8B9PQX3_APTOW
LFRAPGAACLRAAAACSWFCLVLVSFSFLRFPGFVTRLLRRGAQQVDSQCRLLQAAAGRAAAPTLPQLPDEPVSLQAAPGGLFRLPAGDPFAEPATVVWLAVLALGFALVCDPHENLPLAESTLRRLAQRLLGSLRLLSPGSAALLRADSAEALLDRFLPHGQLLFLNEPFVQALDRELGARAAR